MSAPLPVRIVSSAARAIAEAAEWWAANRSKASDAFVTELELALQVIASQPAIGARAKNVKLACGVFILLGYIITSIASPPNQRQKSSPFGIPAEVLLPNCNSLCCQVCMSNN